MSRALWFAAAVATYCFAVTCQAADWPTFRGPSANGLTAESDLPETWDGQTNIRWQADIPGSGWAAPVISDGRVIVATAAPVEAQTGSDEQADDQRPVQRFEVYCFDLASGNVLWQRVATEGRPRIPKQQSNTYASETPVTDGQRIVAYFGMTGLFCYDFDGNLLWQKDLGAFEMQNGWGTSSSPALHDGLVFLQVDNEQDSFLVALDADSGDEQWRVSRDETSNWCSPIIWQNNVRTELVTSGKRVRSYDPASGELLWELNLGGGSSSASPAGNGEFLVVGAENRGGGGGRRGRRGPRGDGARPEGQQPPNAGGGNEPAAPTPAGGLFAVRAGASGDVTPVDGATQSDGVLWINRRASPAMASPLIYEGCVYVMARRGGIVACLDANTGEELYRERLPGNEEFWSSPWAYDGKVFCLGAAGTTYVLATGPEFRLLDSNKIDGQFWASSAMADGALILRSTDKIYCISD